MTRAGIVPSSSTPVPQVVEQTTFDERHHQLVLEARNLGGEDPESLATIE